MKPLTNKGNLNSCLERLKNQYYFTEEDLKKIESISDHEIISVSIASSGGFEQCSGEFEPYEQKGNYRVKIRYNSPGSDSENFILLHPTDQVI
ncbi:hypothetical protein E0K83_07775 [Gramella sp. BOM4]|nr:hypothetical protein [Christiangramia bathymodioli]